MPTKSKIKYLRLYSFHVPVLAMAIALLGLGAIVVVSSNNSEDTTVLGSKSQNVKSSSKSVKTKEATTNKGIQHKKVITEVVTTLEEVAVVEETTGNTETSTELTELAETTDETAAETVEAIDAVESVSPFKKFILGTDYKNLGQLRSSLAHTQNTIRKLTKTSETATPGSNAELEAARAALELEKARINGVVTQAETGFSLFGWLSRLMNGYTPLPEPTATPTPSPSATPDASATPAPTATPVATPTPTPVVTAEPSPTPGV